MATEQELLRERVYCEIIAERNMQIIELAKSREEYVQAVVEKKEEIETLKDAHTKELQVLRDSQSQNILKAVEHKDKEIEALKLKVNKLASISKETKKPK